MTEDNGPYWVNASLEDEEMEEKIWKAWDEAAYIRSWAVQELTVRWQAATGFPTTAQLVPAMTKFINERGYGLQRYSALSILNSTVTTFNRQVIADRTGIGGQLVIVTLPKIEFGERIELTFQARSVWKKYFFNYGQISTVYGNLNIEDGWQQTLDRQVKDMEVTWAIFPYLWYSASFDRIAGQYRLRFNAHPPQSAMGKRLDKKRKEKEKWV